MLFDWWLFLIRTLLCTTTNWILNVRSFIRLGQTDYHSKNEQKPMYCQPFSLKTLINRSLIAINTFNIWKTKTKWSCLNRDFISIYYTVLCHISIKRIIIYFVKCIFVTYFFCVFFVCLFIHAIHCGNMCDTRVIYQIWTLSFRIRYIHSN